MIKHPKHDPRYKLLPAAVEETLKLYHAWLGYLLTLIKADTIRVKTTDITKALDNFTCTVTREGDEYVIRLDKQEEA
ncbi:MAG: hypothetical protein J6B24_03780 [Clostridia bacterium]|nr:hypothetical protein [Clostridia bacterium]